MAIRLQIQLFPCWCAANRDYQDAIEPRNSALSRCSTRDSPAIFGPTPDRFTAQLSFITPYSISMSARAGDGDNMPGDPCPANHPLTPPIEQTHDRFRYCACRSAVAGAQRLAILVPEFIGQPAAACIASWSVPLIKTAREYRASAYQDPMGNFFFALITTAPLTPAIGFLSFWLFYRCAGCSGWLPGQKESRKFAQRVF